ncbi:hypothetical protein [Xenorhabdus bovienii]|uniref:hypothetical protein n=1 Tax=Xenorhabdus bovienii TaxID=40576 RepID=UPI0023B265BF|nr:hypothetical protein [Xenorhabdus bovienii]MDE9535646.1 hypothetical protein [Xenorhabdus bovienii]MDE9588155.1 hypothetical protein [Xenorhabdus bovienii]
MKKVGPLLKRVCFIFLLTISGFFFSLDEPGGIAIGLFFFGLLLWIAERIYSEYKKDKRITEPSSNFEISEKKLKYLRSAELFIFAITSKVISQIAIEKRCLPHQLDIDDRYKLCQYLFGVADFIRDFFGKEVNITESLYPTYSRLSSICYGSLNEDFIEKNVNLPLSEGSEYATFYVSGVSNIQNFMNEMIDNEKTIDEIDCFLLDFELSFMSCYRLFK